MVEEFIKYCIAELGLSRLTARAYRTDLRQWEEFMRSQTPDGEFRPMDYDLGDLRLWIAHLSEHGASSSTVHRKATALKAFYRFLMTVHALPSNPATDLQLARRSKALPVFVSPDETAGMLNADYDHSDFLAVRDRLIMLTLYTTGLRASELVGLRDSAVDTGACELKVHGKRNKDRIVPFGPELSEAIEAYRRLREPLTEAGCDELLVRPSGKPLNRREIYAVAHRLMSLSGVHASRLSPHVMRHSCASDLLNDGAPITAVRDLLGHASLASTQVYTHITYRDLKQNYLTAHPRAQKKGDPYGSKD